MPNFSEGRDKDVINRIVAAIASADEVKILNIDTGEAANRTVITFIGTPEGVCEAAFRGVREAARLIDMRRHHGTHPRLGATDVLPLVPVAGITLQECAVLARGLAARIFRELGIASYCYEAAAFRPERRNLAVCRAGQYEALPERMSDTADRPDFGPGSYDEVAARSGAINIGARNYLIAVNFNLDSKSAELAGEIACDVREKGRKMGVGADGKAVWKRGPLKGCKAIGWYIEEYGVAQVSMNVTDIDATPLHVAYCEVCRAALARGCRVTGTEIIGLVPKRVLLEAGRHFLADGNSAAGRTDDDLIAAAVRGMGLDELRPFDPKHKIIEFLVDF